MEIPFASKELILKQVRLDDLEEIEQLNLRSFFPGYVGGGFSQEEPAPGTPMKEAANRGFPL